MFRPLSEAYIRRSWYSVLPVLDTTGRCHVMKAVICVAQLVAALTRFMACCPSFQMCMAMNRDVGSYQLGFPKPGSLCKTSFSVLGKAKTGFRFRFWFWKLHNCVHCNSAGGSKRQRRLHRVLIW